MLTRIRQAARRCPQLCLLLALAAVSSQGIAQTLDWCLHDGMAAHVENAAAPCDHVGLTEQAHCDGERAASDPGRMIAAADDASAKSFAPLDSTPALGTCSYLPWDWLAATAASELTSAHTRPVYDRESRPRLADAIAGYSARLLI